MASLKEMQMTKDAIWQAFLSRNPDVAAGNDDAKLRMSKGALKRFIWWVAMETEREVANRQSRDMPDFLKGLFN